MTVSTWVRSAVAAATLVVGTHASALVVDLSATASGRPALSDADPLNTRFGAATPSISVVYVSQFLEAGEYVVTPVASPYLAANRFGTVSGCGAGGSGCQTGWEHTYYVKFDPFLAAIRAGEGEGLGPVGSAYYSTAAGAFAAAASTTFTLTSARTVGFYWLDDNWNDNQGGVSLNVALVPEPHEWAMMLAGLALVWGVARRQRERAPVAGTGLAA